MRVANCLALISLFGLSLHLESHAGIILLPGKIQDGEFKGTKETGRPFSIRYSTIQVDVRNGMAKAKIEETVIREANVKETVGIIPLPIGISEAGIQSVLFGGKKVKSKFLGPEQAELFYRSVATATDSVSILSFSGRPALVLENLNPEEKNNVVIELNWSLANEDGILRLRCPMPNVNFTSKPVDRLLLNATFRDDRPLRTLFSPTHETEIERKSLNEAHIRVAVDNYSIDSDFLVCAVADSSQLGLRVLSFMEEGDEEGFFMLIGNPTGSLVAEKVAEKDVVFVLDTSGSMRGEKIEQSRAAVEYCLNHLNQGDRFNIVTFGTNVKSFRPGLVEKSKQNVKSGIEFIEDVVATGRTNISGALRTGLKGKAEKGRPRIMLFLTDGTPTAGELVPESIIKELSKMNESGTQVFVIGVGHDVNAHLLDRLAEDTDGSAEFFEPGDEIDIQIASLYNRLSSPVLTNVKYDVGELRTNSIFPKKLPALFKGSEIMITGRYREGGKHTFRISGSLAGKSIIHECTADLASKPNGQNDFVAPLWANRIIGYFLQEIRLHGENKELINEVVRLSQRYGILTEYTSFIADGSRAGATPAAASAEASRRLKEANGRQSGQWAFNQTRNDKALQQKTAVTNSASNTFVDRRGVVRQANNIQQIGNRTYYLRSGKWTDSEEAGKRKARTVKLFSKEYFELLKNNKDFAKAQKLGWNLSINIGDERIEVKR